MQETYSNELDLLSHVICMSFFDNPIELYVCYICKHTCLFMCECVLDVGNDTLYLMLLIVFQEQ